MAKSIFLVEQKNCGPVFSLCKEELTWIGFESTMWELNLDFQMAPSSRLPKIIFLTGAGLSADSGIATFRGKDGLYAGMRGEDLMSAATFKKKPDLIHRFSDDMRVGLKNVEPNAAHRLIARLRHRFGSQVVHLTQNIDDLAERAGDAHVIHLHGEITKLQSARNPKHVIEFGYHRYWDGDPAEASDQGFQFRCGRYGCLYRPHVVLFEEHAPKYKHLWATFKKIRRDDVLIVIGTQGNVLPVESLAASSGCLKILVNLHASESIDPRMFHHVLINRAADAVDQVEDIILSHVEAKFPSISDDA